MTNASRFGLSCKKYIIIVLTIKVRCTIILNILAMALKTMGGFGAVALFFYCLNVFITKHDYKKIVILKIFMKYTIVNLANFVFI